MKRLTYFLAFLLSNIVLFAQSSPVPSQSLSYPFNEKINRSSSSGYFFIEDAEYSCGWVKHPAWDMNHNGQDGRDYIDIGKSKSGGFE